MPLGPLFPEEPPEWLDEAPGDLERVPPKSFELWVSESRDTSKDRVLLGFSADCSVDNVEGALEDLLKE